MDVYAIVTEKIINMLEQGVVPWRRPWISTGLPRNLVSKKPYRGINYFLLSAIEIRVAVLVDDAPGESAGRTRPEGRGEHDRGFLEGRRREAERRNPRHRRKRRQEPPAVSAQVLSRFQSRTMRTAASGPRQASEDRDAASTRRSAHARRSSAACRMRRRFSTLDRKRFTAH